MIRAPDPTLIECVRHGIGSLPVLHAIGDEPRVPCLCAWCCARRSIPPEPPVMEMRWWARMGPLYFDGIRRSCRDRSRDFVGTV